MIGLEEFKSIASASKLMLNGHPSELEFYDRHHRIFTCMFNMPLQGPTLDVGCGNGLFFKAIKLLKPEMLPYAVTDIITQDIVYDGSDKIECHIFECERTRIPLPDRSVGTILFCDVIEHLIVDPVWAILEFNRVLKDDGHIVISTPNACHIKRVFQILSGENSATENHIKPNSIYQRHNREWTIRDLLTILTLCGFKDFNYSTHSYMLSETEKSFLEFARNTSLTKKPELDFGPEIFFCGRKEKHLTLDSELSIDDRWPDWLYTHYANYRKRPKVFPVLIGEDYG